MATEEEKLLEKITKEIAEIEELNEEIDLHEAKKQSLEISNANRREKIKDKRKLIERVHNEAEEDIEIVRKENKKLEEEIGRMQKALDALQDNSTDLNNALNFWQEADNLKSGADKKSP